jgi:hypothetical protein
VTARFAAFCGTDIVIAKTTSKLSRRGPVIQVPPDAKRQASREPSTPVRNLWFSKIRFGTMPWSNKRAQKRIALKDGVRADDICGPCPIGGLCLRATTR